MSSLATVRTGWWRSNSDLALVGAVAGILLVLFTPIPPGLLDLLLVVNFAFALTILLLTFYVHKPVEFSTFPSLLLIATLFRLALNIAATRLILSQADGGQVIAAIGEFVIQGNFVIGLIVFFILVVVQYVVVTNGAQRVSEVAARFVLDAMPGQQMSIDADLNMGLIDQETAKERRAALEREAAFYGSMDGASKFVKGDAIAGIIILLIDIIGGWVIGVFQMGMPLAAALQRFSLLTIGDGIVTQVPALVVSVATGIIVTRSGSDKQLGAEVLRQLVLFPKIQLLVMGGLLFLLALPGMPKWPILLLLVLLGLTLWYVRTRSVAETQMESGKDSGTHDGAAQSDLTRATADPAIQVALGATLTAHWGNDAKDLIPRFAAFQSQFLKDFGLRLPAVTFTADDSLDLTGYEIQLYGVRYGRFKLQVNKLLAIRTIDSGAPINGDPAIEPAFGLPAAWVALDQRDVVQKSGHTVVDPETLLITHVMEVLRSNASVLLTRSITSELIEGLRASQMGLVEELIPGVMSISDVQRVLQALIAEGVSIRQLAAICEVLVDVGRREKDPGLLAEAVRRHLGQAITQKLVTQDGSLTVLTLAPTLEAALAQRLIPMPGGNAGSVAGIDPALGQSMLEQLMSLSNAMMRQNLPPVLLCSPDLRRPLRQYTQRNVSRLNIVSMSEIPTSIEVRAFATVKPVGDSSPGIA